MANTSTLANEKEAQNQTQRTVSTAKDCPFAWHLARGGTGIKKVTYKKEGSRNHLLSQPQFRQACEEANNRTRKMDVRFVGEPDPLKRALLEVYVAVVSGVKYNDFDAH